MTLEEKVSLVFWSALLLGCVFCYAAGLPNKDFPPLLADATPSDAEFNRETRSVAQLARLPARDLVPLADHYDAAVRGRALAALIRQGAVDELLGLMDHARPSVRSAIPLALASVGNLSTAQLQQLSAAATCDDADVRKSTAYALQLLGAVPLRQASAGASTAQ